MAKNFLQHLYTGRKYNKEINWGFIESFPEIARLKECQQNPRWHSEGDAWAHTKLAYEKLEKEVLAKMDFWMYFNTDQTNIVRAAVILHDIGKGVTTSLGKDGN